MRMGRGFGLKRPNRQAIRSGGEGGGGGEDAIAPVLTLTSEPGTNPMSWSSAYTALSVDEDGVPDGAGDDYICCRWRINGGAWTNEDNVLFDSDFFFEHGIDNVSYPWPLFAAASFSAAELVDVQEGILRNGVTTWGETLSDTMAATDVVFTYGSKATNASATTAVSYTNCIFAGGGRALIFLTCFTVSSGSNSSTPASLTLTPSAGGTGINCTLLGSGGRGVGRAVAIYRSDSDVAAGNYNITGTRPSSSRSNVVMWGTLIGADPAPTTAATFTSGSGTNPHVTSSLTCVANGLLIGAMMPENNTTLTANTDTTLHDQIFFNSEFGLVLGSRSTTGSISFNATPNTTFNWGKGIVAFGPV